MDVNISNFKYSSNRIKVFGLDVTNQNMVDNFFKKINISEKEKFFDIIIDDGSHKLSDILLSFKFLFKNLKKDGFYIIEDYKFPNYFQHLNDVKHIKIDEMLKNIKEKNFFDSEFIEKKTQNFLSLNTEIFTYKGNLNHSDIVFIMKNV